MISVEHNLIKQCYITSPFPFLLQIPSPHPHSEVDSLFSFIIIVVYIHIYTHTYLCKPLEVCFLLYLPQGNVSVADRLTVCIA